MPTKIYFGNLNFNASEEDLSTMSAEFGAVTSSTIIKDKFTNKSKGFGFIEMEKEEDAKKAIENLNGKEFLGRNLRVDLAQSKERKPEGRREGSYGRGGGRDGGGRDGGRFGQRRR